VRGNQGAQGQSGGGRRGRIKVGLGEFDLLDKPLVN
jgi:hypothetical protein